MGELKLSNRDVFLLILLLSTIPIVSIITGTLTITVATITATITIHITATDIFGHQYQP